MLLTRECDYGIRVIRALADGSKKTVDTIATQEQIPKKYAYKIIKKLEKVGFVQSLRGRSGWYLLSKDLSTLSLLDIIAAVDANRYINECIKDESQCPFKDHPSKSCTVHVEIERLQYLLETELQSKPMSVILNLPDQPISE